MFRRVMAVMTLGGILSSPIELGAQTIEELSERVAALEAEREQNGYLSKLGSLFQVYGFLRIDAIYDDSEFNDNQIAFRVLPEGGGFGKRDDDDFTLYPRLTRLGLDLSGPEVGGAALSGKLEIDFYAFNSSDSRDLIRMRHAYLKVTKDRYELLAGQTSDLISPLYPSVNPDLVSWLVGNLGDRRPQIRGTYRPDVGESSLTLAGAIALQGAIDGKNTDAPDGVLDGEDSGLPQFQGRIGFGTKLVGDELLEVGVWGARGWEEVDGDGVGDYDMVVYGIDVRVPIVPGRFSLRGELWQGQNVSDVRGGVGQGISAATLDEIDARGGWLQGTLAVDGLGDLFAGYLADDPDSDDVPFGGVTHNSSLYAGVTVKRWDPLVMGIDWNGWRTRYQGVPDGDANRFRWYIMYKF